MGFLGPDVRLLLDLLMVLPSWHIMRCRSFPAPPAVLLLDLTTPLIRILFLLDFLCAFTSWLPPADARRGAGPLLEILASFRAVFILRSHCSWICLPAGFLICGSCWALLPSAIRLALGPVRRFNMRQHLEFWVVLVGSWSSLVGRARRSDDRTRSIAAVRMPSM